MSTALLINLALAEAQPFSPVVLAHDVAHDVPPERLLAIWCEEQLGPDGSLAAEIARARPVARELRRPLAIWTDSAVFDVSVTPLTTYGDQWWMKCAPAPGETLDVALARYAEGLQFCPVSHVVLVLGMDHAGDEALEVAHVQRCAALARARPDVVGMVWIGTSSLDVLLKLRDVVLPGPPPVEDVEPVGWGV